VREKYYKQSRENREIVEELIISRVDLRSLRKEKSLPRRNTSFKTIL